MLQRRLQVLIDDERHERLTAIARERGVSIGAVVRDAIDRGLGTAESRREAAGASLLAAPPMDVPERVEDLVAEIHTLRDRRR